LANPADIRLKIEVLRGQLADDENLQLTIRCSIANTGRREIFNLAAIAGLHFYRQKTIQGIATDGAWVTVTKPLSDPLQVMTKAVGEMESSATFSEVAEALLPYKETSAVLRAQGLSNSDILQERARTSHMDHFLVIVARFGMLPNEHSSRIASSFILQRDARSSSTEPVSQQNLRLLPIYENRLL
jgi:hypothetical protein